MSLQCSTKNSLVGDKRKSAKKKVTIHTGQHRFTAGSKRLSTRFDLLSICSFQCSNSNSRHSRTLYEYHQYRCSSGTCMETSSSLLISQFITKYAGSIQVVSSSLQYGVLKKECISANFSQVTNSQHLNLQFSNLTVISLSNTI